MVREAERVQRVPLRVYTRRRAREDSRAANNDDARAAR